MMKKLVLVLTALVTAFSSSIFAFAESISVAPQEVEMTAQSDVTPYAEEFEWKFRIYNNKLQKRLWSVTYGYWVGEWENVD